MQTANQWGAYELEHEEELYRKGLVYAAFWQCQCDDGLYRFSTSLNYSYGGYGGPIFAHTGFASAALARDAAIAELLEWLADDPRHVPQSALNELRAMKAALEGMLRQPTLF